MTYSQILSMLTSTFTGTYLPQLLLFPLLLSASGTLLLALPKLLSLPCPFVNGLLKFLSFLTSLIFLFCNAFRTIMSFLQVSEIRVVSFQLQNSSSSLFKCYILNIGIDFQFVTVIIATLLMPIQKRKQKIVHICRYLLNVKISNYLCFPFNLYFCSF